MSDSRNIPKEISSDYGKDYAFLRATGLKYIENLAHRLWTDYNTHDPGVTMLEMLSYAITDLGYRIAMPVEDILAQPKDNLKHMHEQFLSAIRALPSCPVSADDYRQLLVRIKGVRNCWITASDRRIVAKFRNLPIEGRPELHYKIPGESIDPTKEREFKLQGLNSILLDYDESVFLSEEDKKKDKAARQQLIADTKKAINSQVLEVYQRFRNLAEDIDTIREVPLAGVVICGDIDIEPNADPEEVWARIVVNIDQYLAPDIPFYSLREMQEMGKSTDQIFQGPVFDFTAPYPFATPGNPFVKKGFICSEDLTGSELRSEVRLSDLIRIIMTTDGVRLVKVIEFGLCDCDETNMDTVRRAVAGDKWNLCITPGHKPVFCTDSSVLNLFKGVMPIELKMAEARQRLDQLRDERNLKMQAKLTEDLPMPDGRYREVGKYQTFQNDFPETYGIGRVGLADSATTRRKAQAKQLQGYLLFFEQVLANYFAQLENVGILFSADTSIARTYFTTAVQGITKAREIFAGFDNWQSEVEKLLLDTGLDPYISRKNMFLDHLLARFAERFNEYVFLMYRLYRDDADRIVIRQKVEYLKDYYNVSTSRGAGFDYYNPLPDKEIAANVPGMEKRISRLLGFNHYHRLPLSNLSYQVIETGLVNVEIDGVPATVQGYGWLIRQGGETVLASATTFVKKADAYEELGLASLLGCERIHYRHDLTDDGSMVSFHLVNTKGEVIASHPRHYPVASGELPDGPFAQLESVIGGFIRYLLEEFRLEGMYVVENLLLRPDFDVPPDKKDLFLPVCIAADGSFCPPLDPYSFRVTVVLPGYSMRLRNKYFRQYAERLIRMETPAHVLPRICFVSEEHMEEFETVHTAWLASLKDRFADDDAEKPEKLETYTNNLQALIEVLGRLFTIYEEGRLTDCDDDTPEKNPIVLGSSMLGSLKDE